MIYNSNYYKYKTDLNRKYFDTRLSNEEIDIISDSLIFDS
jgi:hypothetical protein